MQPNGFYDRRKTADLLLNLSCIVWVHEYCIFMVSYFLINFAKEKWSENKLAGQKRPERFSPKYLVIWCKPKSNNKNCYSVFLNAVKMQQWKSVQVHQRCGKLQCSNCGNYPTALRYCNILTWGAVRCVELSGTGTLVVLHWSLNGDLLSLCHLRELSLPYIWMQVVWALYMLQPMDIESQTKIKI